MKLNHVYLRDDAQKVESQHVGAYFGNAWRTGWSWAVYRDDTGEVLRRFNSALDAVAFAESVIVSAT